MSAPIDPDRLAADLRRAASILETLPVPLERWRAAEMDGMIHAWRLVAAAIEDGDYDEQEAPR